MASLYPNSADTNAFKIGDAVRWYINERAISPYIGRVSAISPKIVKIWVTWPIGDTTQHGPEELLFVPPEQGSSPIIERSGYDSYDIAQSEKYYGKLTPATLTPSQLQKSASTLVAKVNEGERAKSASRVASSFAQGNMLRIASEASAMKSSGFSDVQAYVALLGKHASTVPDADIKSAVQDTYKEG